MNQNEIDAVSIVSLIESLTQEELTCLVLHHPNASFEGPNYAMDLIIDQYMDSEVTLEAKEDTYLNCLLSLDHQKKALSR